jgi:hypothetical protein
VLHSAEHGQCDQLAGLWWRLAQLRVRVGDRMQRLGRTRTIVEVSVFSTNATDVVHIQEDAVIEHLLAKGPVEPFDMRACGIAIASIAGTLVGASRPPLPV